MPSSRSDSSGLMVDGGKGVKISTLDGGRLIE